LISPDEVARIVPKVVAQANQIVIASDDELEMAASFLTLLATREKEVNATFDPIIAKAHEAHKEALAQKRKFTDPLIEATKTVKGKILTFSNEKERLDRIEQARLQKLAQEKADAEAAEAARLAKEETARRQEAALAEAAQLESQGEGHLADIVLQTAADEAAFTPEPMPVFVAPVVLQTSAKPSGIALPKVWKWEIVDESQLERQYLMPNTQSIGSAVKSQKGMAKIRGVRIWSENEVRRTGR